MCQRNRFLSLYKELVLKIFTDYYNDGKLNVQQAFSGPKIGIIGKSTRVLLKMHTTMAQPQPETMKRARANLFRRVLNH